MKRFLVPGLSALALWISACGGDTPSAPPVETTSPLPPPAAVAAPAPESTSQKAPGIEGGVGDIERIGPTQNGGSRFCRRPARFADEYSVKLPECLRRYNDQMSW